MQNIDIIHYVLICALIPLIIVVNRTLYQKIKSEEHREKGQIVQVLIKTLSMVQYLCAPAVYILTGVLKFSLEYFEFLSLTSARYLISSLTFCTSFLRDYIGIHSLIVCTVRYTFIVYDSSAEIFGVQKLRKIFIGLSIVTPLVSTMVYDAITPIESTAIIYDAFYGNMITSNGTNTTSDFNHDGINLDIQSPIYYITNTFFPCSIIYLMKIIGVILYILIYSNLIEAFLYAHMMIIYKRYH